MGLILLNKFLITKQNRPNPCSSGMGLIPMSNPLNKKKMKGPNPCSFGMGLIQIKISKTNKKQYKS